MKVVVRSSSLLFTILSIVLHVPITRRVRDEEKRAPDKEGPATRRPAASERSYPLFPSARG